MLKKHSFFKKLNFYFLALGFFAQVCSGVYAKSEEEGFWRRYIPEWFQQVSQDTFSETENEKKEIEHFFEWMQPVPEKGSHKKPFIKTVGEEKKPSFRIYGPAELKNAAIEGDVLIFGPLLLRDIQLYELKVEGPFDGNNVHFKGGIVKGPAKLEKCEVVGEFVIHGPLLAQNTLFKGKIFAKGEKVIISSCKVEGDIVMKEGPDTSSQKLFLLEGSEVQGNVIFEKEVPGNQIIIDKASHIHGKIKGALKVEK